MISPQTTKTPSIRYKLLLSLLVPLSVLLLIGAVVSYFIALNFATIANDRALFDSTHDLAEQVKVVDNKITVKLPRIALEMFLSDEYDRVYYRVSDESGRMIAGNNDLPSPPDSNKIGVPIIHDGRIGKKKIRIASLYLPLADNRIVLVQTAETLNKRRILAGQILTGMLIPQMILILTAGLLVWRGVGRGLKPLALLQHEISQRSHRDLSPVPETGIPKEIEAIVHAINELMLKLGSTLEAQQRFMANATHQLRTPLAGLKTQIDLALRQTDPIKIQHSLSQLSVSSNHAIRLVNQLLALSKVEPGADLTAVFSPMDLNALAKEIASEWVTPALNKNIDLGFEGNQTPIYISGNEVQLRMILDNLIDNAIRYCPSNSQVTIKVQNHTDAALIIEDNGPGIPPEERNQIFQRFYRILDRGGEGSGLGLAIVKEAASLHKATVSIRSGKNGKGTSIRVVFPRINPDLENATSKTFS